MYMLLCNTFGCGTSCCVNTFGCGVQERRGKLSLSFALSPFLGRQGEEALGQPEAGGVPAVLYHTVWCVRGRFIFICSVFVLVVVMLLLSDSTRRFSRVIK